MSKTALIAVGGNSLIRAGEKGTIAEQLANTRRTAEAIVGLVRLGYRLVITHGNGPQVGAQLLRSERASDVVYSQTLDVCGACSQGEIGYLLAQSLENELASAGMNVPVASLVTQTLVSGDDPAMQHPTKPVGPFYSRADAEEKKRLLGWQIVEDAERGYRRVVPSPDPVEILELDVIRSLINRGVLVVCTGGGGIPVVMVNGHLQGVEAVIDKDRASALLATQLGRGPVRDHDRYGIHLPELSKARPASAYARDRFAAGRILPGGTLSAGKHGTKGGVGAALPAQRRHGSHRHLA